MKALPYTLLALAIVAAVIWIGWKLFQFAHRKASEESERRLLEARREAKWVHYARPNAHGEWEIGVEQTVWVDGKLTGEEHVRMFLLPGDVSEGERLDAEGEAMVRAGQYNAATP